MEKPITISLCMIVKNEESVIGRCLDCVIDIVDEIIIVDTGSTDKTKEIVSRYTDKIYDFIWIDDFAAARNYAFSLATQEYILWLDADDVILEADRERFIALKNNLDPSVDSVTMNYHLVTDDKGQATCSLRRNRLVKRACGFQWVGAVHECLVIGGNVINSDVAITHSAVEHDSDRNLRIYENRLKAGETFCPRDLYYFANELMDHQLYNRAIEYYQRFLATKQGWIEDRIAACGKLADCFYHLKDRENQLKYIVSSFEHATPRAEFLCRLGYYFFEGGEYQQAIFWYKLATELDKPDECWGTINVASWTWLPHIQLCVCYDRIGEHELANQHNEIAAQFIPDDPRIHHNQAYFASILGDTQNAK